MLEHITHLFQRNSYKLANEIQRSGESREISYRMSRKNPELFSGSNMSQKLSSSRNAKKRSRLNKKLLEISTNKDCRGILKSNSSYSDINIKSTRRSVSFERSAVHKSELDNLMSNKDKKEKLVKSRARNKEKKW